MAKKSPVPFWVRWANILTTSLLRAGVKLNGFGTYPMYLLTVRGRKSGQPRTVPIAIIEQNGHRYVGSPYGIVDWVRNLRAAAGEATLMRGRRTEPVRAIELSPHEAALVLQENFRQGNPFASYFGVAVDAPLEEYERAVVKHPVFMFEGM